MQNHHIFNGREIVRLPLPAIASSALLAVVAVSDTLPQGFGQTNVIVLATISIIPRYLNVYIYIYT